MKLAHALDGSATADALAAGAVNVEQAQVIADAVAKVPAEHRAAGEEHLLGEAETFGPKELGRLGQHIFEVVAPEEAEQRALAELERAERRAWHDRGLWLTDIAGTSQVRITGWLDQEGAATVRAALDHCARPAPRGAPGAATAKRAPPTPAPERTRAATTTPTPPTPDRPDNAAPTPSSKSADSPPPAATYPTTAATDPKSS